MTKRTLLYFATFVVSLAALFSGCKSDKQPQSNHLEAVIDGTVKYAKGFSIENTNDYTKVTIHNPWQKGEAYAVYYLCETDSCHTPMDGFRVQIPLQSVVVNTFSYFEFFRLLNELPAVSGVTDGFRVYNPFVLEGLKNGDIVDLGDPFNPNVEKTMALKPQAIVKSAYAQQDTYNERLLNAGLPIIYSLEWMENSPLGKAEWIKLVAAFFDKQALGDSLFNEIETHYLETVALVENISQKPTVLAGDNFQGTWYVPGGKSFNAQLFSDAALDYYYKNHKESGSIGLDIETILTQFGDADTWFGCEATSYEELKKKDSKYGLLKAVKNQKVYNNHNRVTPQGGNDYFESAIANPHLLLADYIKAAHPELVPQHEFTYIKPLR